MKPDSRAREEGLLDALPRTASLGTAPRPRQAKEHMKRLAGLLDDQCGRFRLRDVFIDFVTFAAIALAKVDLRQAPRREALYIERIKRYDQAEQRRFPEMMTELVMAMNAAPADVLGQLYMELGLSNAHTGQFFTPDAVSELMARLIGDNLSAQAIGRLGYVQLHEPACGSGSMIITAMETLREQGINYQQHVHVTAIDLDPLAAMMAFVQLALLHVPATVINGNTISLQSFDVWYTPAYILDGWGRRLRLGSHAHETHTDMQQASTQ